MSVSKWIWQSPSWSTFSYDSMALSGPILEAREAYARLLGKGQAIGGHEGIRVQEEIWLRDAMSTSAIEGDHLPLESVRASVARRLGVRNELVASAPESVEGLLDVMETAAASLNAQLSADLLCQWQASLFAGRMTGKVEVGKFRTHEEPMQIISWVDGRETVHYEGPPSHRVPEEMGRFIDWFNNSRHEEGIARAAKAHLWFESIHPFEDGNGRIGRAIVDLAISQGFNTPTRLHGFSNQVKKQQAGYYEALGASTDAGNVTAWVSWFAQNFRDGCRANEELIDQSITRSKFWASNRHVWLNDRQIKALNAVLDKGPGEFEGGLTQKKYVAITKASTATASRDLNVLLENGLIKPGIGKGRSTYYDVAIPGWEWKPPGKEPQACAEHAGREIDEDEEEERGVTR
jgi:Fic family protein